MRSSIVSTNTSSLDIHYQNLQGPTLLHSHSHACQHHFFLKRSRTFLDLQRLNLYFKCVISCSSNCNKLLGLNKKAK